MNIVNIQERLTIKAKSDAQSFLTELFNKLYRDLPVSSVPADGLLNLKKSIENHPKQSLNLEWLFRELQNAMLPEIEIIFSNKAAKEFIDKVEALQIQLEEIQSHLP